MGLPALDHVQHAMVKRDVHVLDRELRVGEFAQHGADVRNARFLRLLSHVVEHLLVNVHGIHDPVGGDRFRKRDGKRPGAGADVSHNFSRLELQLRKHLVHLQVDDASRPFHPIEVLIRRKLLQLGRCDRQSDPGQPQECKP